MTLTATDPNGALPGARVKVRRPGSVTVNVAHVLVVAHDTPAAVATIVVWPAALPLANPPELMLATDGLVLCQLTVGSEVPPPPPPPPPELTEKSPGFGVLNASTAAVVVDPPDN